MSGRAAAALLLVIALVGEWACIVKLTGLRRYKEDLVLCVRLHRAEQVPEYSTVPATITVRNSGRVALDFCIDYETEGYEIVGSDKPRGYGRYVDHPGCSQRMTLLPGRGVEWSTSFDILDTPPGNATLSTAVSVVNPLSCREGGCEAIQLRSAPVPLKVVMRSVSGCKH